MPRNSPDGRLTLAEVRALSWAISRTADNSRTMFHGSDTAAALEAFGADPDYHRPSYVARVKLARQAMRKVHELRRQGL
jgi:hypothetical protein